MRCEKRRIAGVAFAVALAAIAGACSAPAKSAEEKPTSVTADLSTFVSDVARDVRNATDSMLGKLGFAPADDPNAKKAAAETPLKTRTPRRRAPVVAPAKLDPEPLHARSLPLAMEAPPAIVQTPFELPDVVDASIVYSQTDLDVEPPRLQSGDLPRWLPPGGLDVDTVEV